MTTTTNQVGKTTQVFQETPAKKLKAGDRLHLDGWIRAAAILSISENQLKKGREIVATVKRGRGITSVKFSPNQPVRIRLS